MDVYRERGQVMGKPTPLELRHAIDALVIATVTLECVYVEDDNGETVSAGRWRRVRADVDNAAVKLRDLLCDLSDDPADNVHYLSATVVLTEDGNWHLAFCGERIDYAHRRRYVVANYGPPMRVTCRSCLTRYAEICPERQGN